MPVVALHDGYKFPSRSRQELYGEDQLVHVMWKGNPLFVAAATFRAPKAMPFTDFMTALVEPWAGSDPAFRPGSAGSWTLDGQELTVDPQKSLAEHGVGHKSLLTFQV